MADKENPDQAKAHADRGGTAIVFQVTGDMQGNTINISGNAPAEPESHSSQEFLKKFDREPETISIPAGTFKMGSEPRYGIPTYETPQHEVFLPAYRIGKYPVTNKEFEIFVRDKGISVPQKMGWDGQKIRKGKEDYPVIGVTWKDAMAYCLWLSKKTEREYLLPNEAQWEKACRGGNTTIFPWGDEFDSKRCNQGHSEIASVKAYGEQNDNGCDFVGNVRQWTCTLWGREEDAPDPEYAYPWSDDGRNSVSNVTDELVWRVLRGSSFKEKINQLRCSVRLGDFPESRGNQWGLYSFRVAMISM